MRSKRKYLFRSSVSVILLLVLLSVFATGCGPSADSIKLQITNDQANAVQVNGSITKALAEVQANKGAYPSWSGNLETALVAVQPNFSPTGTIVKDLSAATSALSNNDLNGATADAQAAEKLIKAGQDAVSSVLGPPDVYTQLATWAGQAGTAITTVQSCLSTTQTNLNTLNTPSNQNYAYGVDDLNNAQLLSAQAQSELGTDPALAYSDATKADKFCLGAITDANPNAKNVKSVSATQVQQHYYNNGALNFWETYAIINAMNSPSYSSVTMYNIYNDNSSSGGSTYGSSGYTDYSNYESDQNQYLPDTTGNTDNSWGNTGQSSDDNSSVTSDSTDNGNSDNSWFSSSSSDSVDNGGSDDSWGSSDSSDIGGSDDSWGGGGDDFSSGGDDGGFIPGFNNAPLAWVAPVSIQPYWAVVPQAYVFPVEEVL